MPTKKDRKIQHPIGNKFPIYADGSPLGSVFFSEVISEALHRQFGTTHAAVKSVVGLTHANERAVKNWFDGKNAPRLHHLVALMRHSDDVLETLLLVSGRVEILSAKKFADARMVLVEMLRLIDDLPGASSLPEP